MPRPARIERAIIDAGALKTGNFRAHNGEQGNLKVELEDILSEHSSHRGLALEIADNLAGKLEPHQPDIIIPIPEGANHLGEMVARKLGVRVVKLAWRDKTERLLEYESPHQRIVIARAQVIAIVDDVFRTGSAFEEAMGFLELKNKTVIGGVVWDRSEKGAKKVLRKPVESVVERYLPLRTEQ